MKDYARDFGPRDFALTSKSNSPRRILLICDFHQGLLSNILQVYKHMANVQVILIRRGNLREKPASNIKTILIPLRVIGTSEKRTVSKLLSLSINTVSYLLAASVYSTYAAIRYRCRVIHARFIFPEGLVGFVSSVVSRTRLIITAEGSDVNLYLKNRFGRSVLQILAKSAKFISVSEPLFLSLRSIGVNSTFIPNSVDGSTFTFKAPDQKKKILVFVGSLITSKRPLLLVEAIGKISEIVRREGLSVKMVGDGPLKKNLQQRIKDLRLDEVISLEGYLNSERVRSLLSDGLIYVNCSVVEGMSVALLEAMASGCIIVASDIPANCSIIKAGERGFLFRMDDVGSLAETIRSVLENPSNYFHFVYKNREYFDHNYDLRNNSKKLMEAYCSSRYP